MSEEAVKTLEGLKSGLKDIKEQLVKVSRLLRDLPQSYDLLELAYKIDDIIHELDTIKSDLEFTYEIE